MSIFYFPKPYEDELLYSTVARYHTHIGNRFSPQSKKDLFPRKDSILSYDLPVNIEYFTERIKNVLKINGETCIYSHTVYPYYATFLPTDSRRELFLTMKNYSNLPQAIIGNNGKLNMLPTHFKYCKSCLNDDMKYKGETYWRRAHLLPGVFLCAKHNEPLYQSKEELRGKNLLKLINLNNDVFNGEKYKFPIEWLSLFQYIAKESIWLLKNEVYIDDINKVGSFYMNELDKKKLVKSNGHVKAKDFEKQFVDFFGNELLDFLNCNPLKEKSDYNIINRLFTQRRWVSNPLIHLLCLYFFKKAPKDLIYYEKTEFEKRSFNEKSYPCLNPVCHYYLKNVIIEVEETRCKSTNMPRGLFRCNCGFTYTRRGPDLNSSDRYNYESVKEYGQIWKEKFIEYVEQFSMNEVANKMNICSHTVKKLIKKYNLNSNIHINSVQKVRGRDLKEEDERLLDEIKKIHNRFMNSPLRPFQITISRIAREVKRGWLIQKELDSLPKSKALLEEICEEKIERDRRLIKWAAKTIFLSGEQVYPTKVRNVSKCRNYSEEIYVLIQEEVKYYQKL